MRQDNKRSEHDRNKPVQPFPAPQNRHAKKRQAQRNVKIHESHVKRVTVREHGDARAQIPRRAPRRRTHQRKHAPEKNQNGRRNCDFLRHRQRKNPSQPVQPVIEQHIIPAPRQPHPPHLPALDQLRKPRVINVAAQISRGDHAMPKTRHQHGNRHAEKFPEVPAQIRKRLRQHGRPRGSVHLRRSFVAIRRFVQVIERAGSQALCPHRKPKRVE